MASNELDVRELRKPDKHPTIFATYAALPVGESFVLVNNHDPKHLHDEFETDHAGSYEWEVLGDDAGRERPEEEPGHPTHVEKGPAVLADPHQQTNRHPAPPDPGRHRHRGVGARRIRGRVEAGSPRA
jgi:hypothetical protein